MFKIIKKWYFKIYHLFKLLGIFILIFGIKENVFAEECNNLFDNKNKDLKYNISGTTTYVEASKNGTTSIYINTIEDCDKNIDICIEKNKDYIFYILDNNNNIFDMKNLKTNIINIMGTGYSTRYMEEFKEQIINIKTNKRAIAFYFEYRNASSTLTEEERNLLNNLNYYIIEGTKICIPEQTTPEPEDNVYSNFLTLYVDRINYLATGFTSNPYLIAMVSIIIAWGVLELTIKIINIRRKK